MLSFMQMPAKARIYWAVVTGAGLCSLLASIRAASFRREELLTLLLFNCAALAVSRLKVRIPGILVTLSVNYVVIISALLNLSLPGAMLVGIAGALGQSYVFASQRPKWFQAVFNAAAIPLPILAASFALHLNSVRAADATGLLSLIAASLAYFFVNTIAVAGIVSFSAGKSLFPNWRQSYLWTFPQYLAGGIIAGGVHFLQGLVGWTAIVIGLPAVYLVYASYRTYMGRLEELQQGIRRHDEHHAQALKSALRAASDPGVAALLEQHLRELEQNDSQQIGFTSSPVPA